MSLRQIVEDHSGRLTKSDRRLVQVLLSNPRESAFLSTQDLAERAAVHPTTAVRLARKLGFGGYPDLRAKLQDELFGESHAVERVQQRLEHLGHGSLEAFVQSEIATLSALPSQISQQELEKTAETLVEGKNRHIKKVCEHIGHPVIKLQRTHFGGLNLTGLPLGACRFLSPKEVRALKKLVADEPVLTRPTKKK